MKKIILGFTMTVVVAAVLSNCKGNTSNTSDSASSQIAAGAVGGSSNDGANGGTYASNAAFPKPTFAQKLENAFNLLPLAHAFTFTCTASSISPSSYTANQSYVWTPASCSLAFKNGKSTSTAFTGTYTLNYNAACMGSGFGLATQSSGCVRTRTTTGSSGVVRTLTGVDGNSLSLTNDTTVPSGYDTSVVTSAGGNITTCTAGNCATRTIAISGSHASLSLTPSGGTATTLWDHTYSTLSSDPIAITGTGTTKVVNSGTIVVQHNIAKFTSTAKVTTPLAFTISDCCFPASGVITSTFTGGTFAAKTETLTFTSSCGEATLIDSSGASSSVTLQHCL